MSLAEQMQHWCSTLIKHVAYNPLPEGNLHLAKEEEGSQRRCYLVDEEGNVQLAVCWNEERIPRQVYWLLCNDEFTLVVHLVNDKLVERSFQLMCEVYPFEEITKEVLLAWWARLMNGVLVGSKTDYARAEEKTERGDYVVYLYNEDNDLRAKIRCSGDGAGVIHILEATHPHPFYRVDITVDPYSSLYTMFMNIKESAKVAGG